ncbi:MAG: BadF/BadG/BcrA/BcrD ATPase family protein [Propionicimonas sp.]|uniref:N-acetylglucosamine kinase n=1 Tax=Propionicimonas sp. TaxID=1955623 RepID=UPI003D116A26
MSGLLALDAGQTGIRLRWEHGQERLEGGAPGVLTDRPLMPQLAAAIGDFVTGHRLSPTVVGVGTSGLVTPEATELLGLVSRHGIREVAVAHDATTSYLGALGDASGAVIAAGTGVVTLAVGAASVARVDGWGYLIGDAGSAYWIGRAGMDAAMRGFDGRGRLTPLTGRLQQLFPDLTAAYVELQSDGRKVSRIADFAKVVDELADSDPVAMGIMDAAAAELSESVLAGLRRVELMGAEAPKVCALGQVLRSTHVRDRFTSYLRMQWPDLSLAEPLGNALHGAALLANLGEDSPLAALVARAEL